MKALVLKEDSIAVENVDGPTQPENLEGPFTTLNVMAAALNHRDQYIREGLYSQVELPAILGSDVCGTLETGDPPSDDDERFVVDPTFNWGDEDGYQNKEMTILGMPTQGGFAEQICVPMESIHPAPKHLTDEEAAALPVAGVTAWRALMYQGRCSKYDTVYVTGAGGGVATMAMLIAKHVGCKVIVSSRSQEKLDKIETDVEKVLIDDKGEWVKTVKALKPNLIVDSIGGDTLNHLTDIVVPGGRIVVYGSSTGKVGGFNLHRIFWKQITLRGSTMGSQDDFADMLSFVEVHKIRPLIDKVYTLDQGEDAFNRLRDAEQLGKVVFKIHEN